MQTLVSTSIASVTVSFAVPKVKQSEMQSRATVIASDFRAFAAAFEAYAQERGNWPAEADAGVIPPEMEGRFAPTAWTRITPLGGRYNWEFEQLHNGARPKAALSISATADAPILISEETLRIIDQLIDDGNLDTGSFRTGVNFDPLYIIQQ